MRKEEGEPWKGTGQGGADCKNTGNVPLLKMDSCFFKVCINIYICVHVFHLKKLPAPAVPAFPLPATLPLLHPPLVEAIPQRH